MVKQNLVKTWLSAIGLSPQIVDTFEAAGIVHPKDLAELEVCHYPALGVKDSADRKKLFYLVQRVKLAVPDGNGDGTPSGGGSSNANANSNDNDKYSQQQRAGEPTSVSESDTQPLSPDTQHTPNSNSNAHSFEIDNGDDDGIDEALEEQYKPLLHDSSDDEDSFDSFEDDYTSDEDVPSPPTTPDPYGDIGPSEDDDDDDGMIADPELMLNVTQSPSPQNTKEAAFLSRRAARLEKVTPPRKTKKSGVNGGSGGPIPKLQKPTKDTPERYKKSKRGGGAKKFGLCSKKATEDEDVNNLTTSSPSSQSQSSSNKRTTTLMVKKKRSSPRKATVTSKKAASSGSGGANGRRGETTKAQRIRGDHNEESSSENNSSPTKHRSPKKSLDMEPIDIPDDAAAPMVEISDPPVTRRRRRLESKLSKKVHTSNTKSASNASTSPSTETDGEQSNTSKKSSRSSRHSNRRSAADINLALSRSSDNDSFDAPRSKKTTVGATPAPASSSTTTAKERRSRLQNPTSRIETKRLSTIPSDRPHISSQFRASTTSIDEILDSSDADLASVSTSNTSTSKIQSNSTSNRKRTTSAGDQSFRSISSRISIKSSKSYRVEKTTSIQKEDLASRAKSTPRGRVAKETVPRVHSPISPNSNSLKSKSFEYDKKESSNSNANTPKSTKSGASSGAVFVHRGGKTNKSWSSRVAVLRDANVMAHEDETGGYDVGMNEDEMRIRVVVRKRPMSRKEASKKDEVDVIHPLRYADYGRILVYQPKTRVDLTKEVETLPFAFDNVFGENSNNCQIYTETIKPLIPGAFEGRWASVFAYGQTGSGKTFTMMGSTLTGIKAKNRNVEHEKNYGLYVLAARDIFEFASKKEYSHLSVGASLFEIYGGKLFDLLNDRAPVKCLENHKGRVCFPGLSEHPIEDAEQLMALIEHGSSNRSTGSTSANRDSSRSHAVLQLHLRKTVGRRENIEHGRLTFIDLAGSERGADTNKASRTTRLEGADINTSLLALKEVIRALATGDSLTHIPFRGSKLTQVLKESFVGKNSRTVMVACVAPNMTNCEHTVNTLRYADRVKERNAESGRLPDSIAAASSIRPKHRPISFPNRTKSNADADGQSDDEDPDEDADADDNWLSDLDDDSSDNDEFDNDDEGIDELNEVLRSPVATRLDGDNFFGKDVGVDSTVREVVTKKEAVAPLVSTHRSIMTEMLGMVKQEMILVNCTDADRELIDDYLDELETIQDQQLAMIATLRESLVHYYAHRPSDGGEEGLPSDDSFDDLRSPQR